MGGPAAVASEGGMQGIAHLIDTSRPWWKNRRLIALNGWIFLLCVVRGVLATHELILVLQPDYVHDERIRRCGVVVIR